jgi:DNA repair ATPase RecN
VLTVSTPTAYPYDRERYKNDENYFMTRLSDAQDRLDRALSRLEQASAQLDNGAGENSVPADEFELLRARYDKLHGVTRKISDRLDAAVDRMKTALDS